MESAAFETRAVVRCWSPNGRLDLDHSVISILRAPPSPIDNNRRRRVKLFSVDDAADGGLRDAGVAERLPVPIRAAVLKGTYNQGDCSDGIAAGKYLAWSILSIAFFLAFFQRAAPGVLVDRLMSDFHVGGAAVGVLASIYCYIYMAMQIPTGVLADTVGPARTVALGSLVAAAGSLLFSLAHTMTVACIARFLVGLGVSVAFICALKAQALWFEPAAFVAMSGLLSVIGTLGNIAAATPLAAAANIFGWRPAFMVSAAASLIVALFIWVFIPRERNQHVRHGSAPNSVITTICQVLRNRQTWLCSIMHFGWLGTYVAFTGLWGIPYLMQVYGLARFSASNVMVWASIAFTAGAFLLGLVSGRLWPRRKPLLLTAGITLLLMWLMLVLLPPALLSSKLAVCVVIVASLASSASVLTFAIAKESNPPYAGGLAMAFTNSGILCGGLLQVIMGCILDQGWQGKALASGAHIYPVSAYQRGFIAFIIVGLAALLAAVFIREDDFAESYGA